MTNPMVDHITREFRKFIVGKQMFCPITGEVLDVDKSVFILDADGDAAAAFSQAGWQTVLSLTPEGGNTLAEGYTVDESTVR